MLLFRCAKNVWRYTNVVQFVFRVSFVMFDLHSIWQYPLFDAYATEVEFFAVETKLTQRNFCLSGTVRSIFFLSFWISESLHQFNQYFWLTIRINSSDVFYDAIQINSNYLKLSTTLHQIFGTFLRWSFARFIGLSPECI